MALVINSLVIFNSHQLAVSGQPRKQRTAK